MRNIWEPKKEKPLPILKKIALGRSQAPEDVADLVSFLVSSNFGQNIIIDGVMLFN